MWRFDYPPVSGHITGEMSGGISDIAPESGAGPMNFIGTDVS